MLSLPTLDLISVALQADRPQQILFPKHRLQFPLPAALAPKPYRAPAAERATASTGPKRSSQPRARRTTTKTLLYPVLPPLTHNEARPCARDRQERASIVIKFPVDRYAFKQKMTCVFRSVAAPDSAFALRFHLSLASAQVHRIAV